MKISLVLGSRARPLNMVRLVETAIATADNPDDVDFVFYIDYGDVTGSCQAEELKRQRKGQVNVVHGPRIFMSQMADECIPLAKGEIYMAAGDDIVFVTKGWDTQVVEAFKKYPDKIVMVYGDDGTGGAYVTDSGLDKFGTHFFLHKNWVDAVGYFNPPIYVKDFVDTHINTVADVIKRRCFIPSLIIEHHHYTNGKAPFDETYALRLDEFHKLNPQKVFLNEGAALRTKEIKKLENYIAEFKT